MAHEIEINENGVGSAFYVKQPAWHKLGVVLDSPPDTKTAIVQAGLDWKVEAKDLYYQNPETVGFISIPKQKALVRTKDQRVLGIVGKNYKILQNEEAFDIFDPLIKDGQLSYEAAGSLRKGERIWLLAKFNESFEVVRGDQVDSYLTLVFGHDGKMGIMNYTTGIRVVCANTVSLSIAEAEKAGNLVKFAHKGDLKAKIETAQAILGVARKQFHNIGETFKALLATPVNEETKKGYVEHIIPMPFQASDRQVESIKEDRNMVQQLHETGLGTDIQGVRGSAWGLYNAAVEFADFYRSPRAKDRANYILAGDGSRFKRRAYSSALKLAGIGD